MLIPGAEVPIESAPGGVNRGPQPAVAMTEAIPKETRKFRHGRETNALIYVLAESRGALRSKISSTLTQRPNDAAHLPGGRGEQRLTKSLQAPPVRCSGWFGSAPHRYLLARLYTMTALASSLVVLNSFGLSLPEVGR